jgi:hypothetical protein
MKLATNQAAAAAFSNRRIRVALLSALALAVLGLAAIAWLTDFFSLQGERTIYTADCAGGAWVGDICSGAPHAGDRYTFRAFKDRREVTVKRLGSTDEEHRMTNCSVVSGRDWSCGADARSVKSVVYTMVHGQAAEPAQVSRSTRCVSKLRWLTLAAAARRTETKDQ